MRAHIALALLLVGGVALAGSPSVIISPPPSLPLAGGSLTGATTSSAQFKSTLTPTAAGGFTTASAFDTAPFSAVVTSAGAFVPMWAARDTGVTNSGMAIVSASAGRSPYLVGNNSTGSAQLYSEGNSWGMSSNSVLVAQFATTASQIASPLDVRGSITNGGASNGGAVHVADALTATGDFTGNGEFKSTATGAFFYISSTTPAIAARPDRVDLYVAARSPIYQTWTNCTDSAGAAACTAAPAGSVVIDAGATTVTVSTTAVTANSQVFVMEDSSLETRLGLGAGGCNSTYARTYYVSARTAGTSFQITSSAAPITKPACLSYFIVN